MARLTIPDEPTFREFTVVGSTSVFPISFSIFAKADLTVLVNGVALLQSGFTFSGTILDGGGYDGGTVTLNTAVSNTNVRIERNVTPVRTSNFAPAGTTPVSSVDQALNRLTATDQDLRRFATEGLANLRNSLDEAIEEAGSTIGFIGKADTDGSNVQYSFLDNVQFALNETNAQAQSLRKKLGEVWSVRDFGAKGDGVTDDWLAIQLCVNAAAGKARVHVPAGTYLLSREIALPSLSYFYGDGDASVIKIGDIFIGDVPDRLFCCITNAGNSAPVGSPMDNSYLRAENNPGTDHDIYVGQLKLDGNFQRLGGSIGSIGAGGGSGVAWASVRNSIVDNVYSVNAVKHGFDVGAKQYSVATPTSYADGPSYNATFVNCRASMFGDDGFTTHMSGNITLINPQAWDSDGHYTAGNSNGCEIDDGSYDVTIFGGYFRNCAKGLEIKAHNDAPAPKRVRVYGVTAEANNVNYLFRHEGFETAANPSATARQIDCYGLVSIRPRMNTQGSLTPRHFNILAYDGVLVDGFTCIGSGSVITAEQSTIAFRVAEGAKNVVVRNGRFQDVLGVSIALLQAADGTRGNVRVENISAVGCDATVVVASSGVVGFRVDGVDGASPVGTVEAIVVVVDNVFSGDYEIRNVTGSGYSHRIRTGSSGSPTYWDTVGQNLLRGGDRTLGTDAPSFDGDRSNTGDLIIARRAGTLRFGVNASSSTTSIGARNGTEVLVCYNTGDSQDVATGKAWSLPSAGSWRPYTDNTQSLGEASRRASVVYAGTGTINTSDAREKSPVNALTSDELAASKALAAEIGTYRFLAAIAEKGDDARKHVGMTVQRSIEIMAAHNLDPFAYGFICHDTWDATAEVLDDESGEVISTAQDAGDRYSFRPDELLMFIARGMEARLATVETLIGI